MSDNDEKSGAERRKYQRVQFEASPQTLDISLIGFGRTLVFDMSFNGAALAQPTDKKVVTTGENITMHLKTAELDAKIEGRVVRCTDKVVALEFLSVPAEARSLVDRLISDRMIGLNMHLIDSKHYGASQTFSHWFHGPKETNLFLWSGDNGKLDKAQFDLNNVILVYENDMFFYENKSSLTNPGVRLNHQQILQKSHAILSQMHSNLEALNTLKDLIAEQIG